MVSHEFGEIIIKFSPEAAKAMSDLQESLRETIIAIEEMRKAWSEENRKDDDN